MFLTSVLTSGSLPSLEATLRFAGQRQAILAHNIANLTTPGFVPLDVSPSAFQQALSKAIEERRTRTGGEHGRLELKSTREVEMEAGGRLRLTPRTPPDGVLFHDRNNRDLERAMQSLAENAGVFRITAELIRHRVEHLRGAIAERV